MSDSVGKISLDLEVQSDLAGQISSMSNLIGKNLKTALEGTTKNTFDNMDKGLKKSLNNMNSSIKNTFNKMQTNLKSLFSSFKNIKVPNKFELPPNQTNTGKVRESKMPSRGPPINKEILGAKIQNVSSTLDNVNAKIEQQQAKLAQLREAYNMTFNQGRKNKLEEQMLKTGTIINKLIGQSDKLGFQLSELDMQYSKLGNSANGASAGTSKLSNSMKNLERNTKKAGNSFRSSQSGLSMFLGSMLKWGIIFPMIQRGIMGLASGLLASLKTNQQFSNSLAIIKTNLQVAFTPIFYAILPAINALMSALSTVTTYIASFISSLFGKTYKSSFQATQGLIDAKAAMGAYGDAAQEAGKKAKGALAGFDEINSLNMQDDAGSSGGGGGSEVPTLTMPDMDTSAVDSDMKALAGRVKELLSTIFTPFKLAWDKVGTGVVSEFNEAIQGTKQTLKNFFEMLNTPPVQGFLQAIGELAFTIGKLALFIYNNFVLPLINWFINITPPILAALTPIIESITNFINWLMNDGKPVLDIIITVLGSMAATFLIVNGVVNIASGTMKAFGAILDFGKSKIGITILVIGALIAIGVLLYKNWDTIKAKCGEVWDWVQAKFQQFDNFLTSVFRRDWTESFGILGNVLNGFYKSLDHIWSAIKNIFGGVIDFLAGVFTGNWDRAFKGIYKIVSGVAEGIGLVFTAPINFITGLLNAMVSAINVAIRGINKLSWKVPDWVPGVGGQKWGFNIPQIPKIPYLAKGGIIDSPTLAMVGEAGKEAVVPLENNTQGLDLLAEKLLSRMPSGGGNSDSYSGDLILMIDGSVIGKVALKQLRKMQRQGAITLMPT